MNLKHSILALFILICSFGYSQNCDAVIDVVDKACINTVVFFTGSASNNLLCPQGNEQHKLRILQNGAEVASRSSSVGVGRNHEFSYSFSTTGTYTVEYTFIEHPSCESAKTCTKLDTIEIIEPNARFTVEEIRVCENEEFSVEIQLKDAEAVTVKVGSIFSRPLQDDDGDGVIILQENFPGLDTFTLEIDRAGNQALDCQNTNIPQSVKMFRLKEPDFESVQIMCDSANLTYVMQFELIGGEPSAYSLVNPEDGELNGNILTTKRIAAGDTFDIDINFGEQCGIFNLRYTEQCECNLAIEDFNVALKTSCAYDPLAVDLASVNGDDPNYRVLYVLHGELENTLESDQIIEVSSTGVFDLDDPELIDTTLYVTAVYGPFNLESFDYNLPNCKDKSFPKPVQWSGGNIQILGDNSVCENSRNIFYSVNSSTNIDVKGITWDMISQDGSVILDSVSLPGLVISFDSPGQYRLKLSGDFQLNEVDNCIINDSIEITVQGNNNVVDLDRKIILWPGNIFSVNDDLNGGASQFCYQWGYIDKATDRPVVIPEANDRFFYEDISKSILPSGVLEERAYFVVVYGNGQSCNPLTALDGCYDVLFYNSENIFRLDAPGFDDFSLNYYPNPSKGLINVDLKGSYKGNYNLRIINSVGQPIYKKSINKEYQLSKNTINLDNHSPGLYYIEVTNEFGERTIEKLIKV